ncbi:MAG TPA: polynucleotide adenylyltransferase PcnB [Spongiibacteraceae bacterium]
MNWLTTLLQQVINRRVSTFSIFGATATASAKSNSLAPAIIPRDQHNISRKLISSGTLKVIARLRAAGFQAYLVGGGVRDLLLGGHPKDFDVATDAHPEQVRELFRGSRIIGRRFKIVHVRLGGETIEVTTFRSNHNASADETETAPNPQHSARNEDGMLLRDNVYGTIAEDAARRDFTVNALYYTTENFAVHDFTGGMKDLENRLIRIIGDPATRYREDPVRMLRAARFAAKLDFAIEPNTAKPLRELAHLLGNVPAARMFDEVLKLFMAGYGAATYRQMSEHGLFAPLFPATAAAIDVGQSAAEMLIMQALHNTDQRIAEHKPVTPAFIYAALLWPALQRELHELTANGMPESVATQQATQTTLDRQQQLTGIPRRFSQPMREIWELQARLQRRDSRRALTLLEHPRLRAAYDFLLLREQAGEALGDIGAWWTEFMAADEEQREHLLRQVATPRNSGSRRRRSRKPRVET